MPLRFLRWALSVDAAADGRVRLRPERRPAGRHDARSVDRGHHRVPPAERAARHPVPGRLEADGDRQHHLPGRLAPRELRRDRHGAPARAPAVQGLEELPEPDVEFSRRGFQNNGTTWLDRTNYYSTFQASDDNLKWAIDWSADAMVNSFIAKKDLDSEMTVVRNEYEMGENDPTRVMLKRMQSVMYDWHNYGNSTIGARSDIENVRIENLQAFYRTYYQPDNAVLTIAGKFDENKVLDWVAQSFGKIPRPEARAAALWTVEPTHDGERTVAVRRKGEVQIVVVGYRLPSALHPDFMAAALAADILGDTPAGRLHQALVVPGKAAQVFAFTIDARDPGFVLFGAVVKKGEPIEPVTQTTDRDHRGQLREDPRHRRGTEAAGAAAAHRVRSRARRSAGLRRRPVRVHRARRLAAVLPVARPARADDAGADRRRRRSATSSATTGRSATTFPTTRRSARRCPRAPTAAQRLADYKPTTHRGGGGGVRPLAGEHRQAHAAAGVRGPQGGAAAEAEPRQHRARADQLPLGRREDPQRPRAGGRDGGQHARRAARRR